MMCQQYPQDEKAIGHDQSCFKQKTIPECIYVNLETHSPVQAKQMYTKICCLLSGRSSAGANLACIYNLGVIIKSLR